MSRNQRIGLLVAAAVVAVVAIVVAVASGGSDDSDQAAQTTQTTRTSNEQAHETLAQNQEFHPIQIKGGKVVGGPPNITVKKGEHVRIVVSADAHDDIHLHGGRARATGAVQLRR